MATKFSKSDWNALLKNVQQTGRQVRQFIEGAPIGAGIPSQDPVLQKELLANALAGYRKLEEAGMCLNNILRTYDGVVPFAGQAT